ncbi:OsmC family protein [Haliangium sp.]|uniref:OsmC family protein n=1 Tax=Haliangium sp. TaxID=2663208 RepID=UPI003D10E51C
MAEKATGRINGIDTDGLRAVMKQIVEDPAKGKVKFEVRTEWKGQCKMQTFVRSYDIGGETVARTHTMLVDEPIELLGENAAPNPQEVLMAAFNSCIMVGYTVGAAMKGITLDKLEVHTDGELDLRGFLGLDASIKPGYDTIRYRVHIKGNGTKEQFQEIHDTVCATSPNRFNVASPIALDGALVVED